MRGKKRRRWGLVLSLLGFLSLNETFAKETTQARVTVRQVWARATPEGSKVGVAYFTLEAQKGTSDTLLRASSPAAGKVEIHTHEDDKGILRMRVLEKLPLPAGQMIVFEPRGYHLMLKDLKQPLKEGEHVPLSLIFEKAGTIEVEAQIRPVGSLGYSHGHHTP